MTKTEYLEQICANLGVDISTLPDRLLSTYLSAISEKLGIMKENGTLAEYLNAFADLYSEGVSNGEQAEYNRFWDGMQNYGERTSLAYMFVQWQHEKINPKYPLPTTNNLQQTFYNCSNITEHPPLSLAETGAFFYQTFNSCAKLKEIKVECVGDSTRANSFEKTFNQCRSCVKIEKIVPAENHTFSNTFAGCVSLVEIRFGGTIGKDINFQDCPLSAESAYDIVMNLKVLGWGDDQEEPGTYTLYLNEDTWARLSDYVKANLVPSLDEDYGGIKFWVTDNYGWNVA